MEGISKKAPPAVVWEHGRRGWRKAGETGANKMRGSQELESGAPTLLLLCHRNCHPNCMRCPLRVCSREQQATRVLLL